LHSIVNTSALLGAMEWALYYVYYRM